jgi:serine/threonine protein kinase
MNNKDIQLHDLLEDSADLWMEDGGPRFSEEDIVGSSRKSINRLLSFDSCVTGSLASDIAELAELTLKRIDIPELLCGPYRLLEVLGRGGMGSVYLAERVDSEVRPRVALKLLGPAFYDRHMCERFLAERRILGSLSHPNIATLLDAGYREDGQPYLVMEYVDGQRIDVYTAEFGIRQTVRLFLKVCGAVSYLHRNLVVHRDLKPANILVTTYGEPKLLDFGIAKIAELTNDSRRTSTRLLTPDYASPEQVTGCAITTASDIYSLGAVLYTLLTGESPHQFENDSARAIVTGICAGRITPPSMLLPALNSDLESVILKALRREPEERYSTVEQFAEDVENALECRPIRARGGNVWYRAQKFVSRWLLHFAR